MTRFGGAAEDSCKKIQKKSDNHLAKNGIVCYCKTVQKWGACAKQAESGLYCPDP